ncbi:MAG: Stp1/IreP family PP2C-type Ser/Thr phosphatase [Anaerolineae bacterium]|nr:Stp1/IreP family PP2C-type Ser/Thr phosphatase [Anaerolineae bacterium]
MSEPGHNIRLRSSARTNIGQVRQNNEDSVQLWAGETAVLAVVADGMGGAAAGEEASRLAVEAIGDGMALHASSTPEYLEQFDKDKLSEELRNSILKANLSILQKATEMPELRGMGTTVTMAFVRGTFVTVAHVGDSRAYQVNAATTQIKQITSDHSFVEALYAAGHITREQADEHPMRNVLYRALGQTEDIDVDVYHTYLRLGDRLVLCSDGLTRHVKPGEIARIVLSTEDPAEASQQLIDMANERGGEDNVSVIVVMVEDTGQNSVNTHETITTAAAPDPESDDTVILAERPQALKEEAAKRRSAKENLKPNPKTTPPGNKPPVHDKMDAERLSDSSTKADESANAPGAETLPERTDRNTSMIVNCSASTTGYQYILGDVGHESDGEGRDTFTPQS